MTHQRDNRQVRIPGAKDHNITDHCKKFGISSSEERKLRKLLGNDAPLHEIQANSAPRQPRFR
ncbi:hypothetical protein ASE04_05115 [Rhizobium sp. Root708]|uniref:Uncharacterized protein n=1 Tax=Rhizobium grahamii TaxID=1120045 RepID=A0A5Q0CCW4_9HYPH|nr:MULTISPECIES: hypothetical protein [Rhizobium]KRB55098.1 hypothetical protein ASE04_05115 [Rhizobium sp. Root708]QFY63175.1 hypothetical protein FZ934_23015 [Rhizobium grahamii]QRM52063.1 hypothetical protein F3Y33_22635 [Rhizobium sp. BG6]